MDCDPGQAAHTAQGKAAPFSRGTDSVGKGTLATIQGLSVAMSVFPHRERFVIKMPQTVLPSPSHIFTSPRTPVSMSGDKKGQSYSLIWSSLLYSSSALWFYPQRKSLGHHDQLSKHSKPPEEAAAGSTPGTEASYPHTHRKPWEFIQPSSPSSQGVPSHECSRLVLTWVPSKP